MLEFGTSGYTMNNVFVLYDRNSDSVWYPLSEDSFDGVSGPNKGKRLDFIAKPEVMRLHEWAKMHPGTQVLLPPPPSDGQRRAQEQRTRLIAKLVGAWAMTTQFQGQGIDATLTLEYQEGEGFVGTWATMGRDMELSEIFYDGKNLSFEREGPSGEPIKFTGTVGKSSIEGAFETGMGELKCAGTKTESEPAASRPDH